MTMELGGKVTIECEKTRYATELEFKLKVRNLLKGQVHFSHEINIGRCTSPLDNTSGHIFSLYTFLYRRLLKSQAERCLLCCMGLAKAAHDQ